MDIAVETLLRQTAKAKDAEELSAAVVDFVMAQPSVAACFVIAATRAGGLAGRCLAQQGLSDASALLLPVERALRNWQAGVKPPQVQLIQPPPPRSLGLSASALHPELHLYPVAGKQAAPALALGLAPRAGAAPSAELLRARVAARDLLELAQARFAEPAGIAAQPIPEDKGTLKREAILTRSPVFERIFKKLERVVSLDVPVLVMGETGTGKELIARAIHKSSPRRRRHFYAQNCGAISEGLLEAELFGYLRGSFTGAERDRKGLFEVASGSTLFLDEVGEMDLEMQKKLLRVLQEKEVTPIGATEARPVDVRIVCATNRKLQDEVASGRFREDLYYRLQVIQLTLPPLRERREDIPLLVDHFLARVAERRGRPKQHLDPRDPRVLDMLMAYDWPGNVRELENAMTRLAHFSSETITLETLREDQQFVHEFDRQEVTPRPVRPLALVLAELERQEIENALRHTRGNRSHAADLLRVNRRSLLRRLKKYGL